MTEQDTVEQAAEKRYQTTSMSNQIHRENMEMNRKIFIDGAKSEAAKEYWRAQENQLTKEQDASLIQRALRECNDYSSHSIAACGIEEYAEKSFREAINKWIEENLPSPPKQ